jgi:DNA replication protein DnaC
MTRTYDEPEGPIDRDTINAYVDEIMQGSWDLAWQAAIPVRFRNASLGALPREVRDPCHRWAEAWAHDSPEAGALLLIGPVGTGKTYAAVATAREYEVPLFVPVVELLDALRPGGDLGTITRQGVTVTAGPVGMQRFAAGVETGLVILDDLGAERPTEWTAERLYAIVNRRWMDQQPTIVTANTTPEKMAETFGPRIYSRLVHNATVVRVGGEDRRRRPPTS